MAAQYGLWDFSSLTRDWTQALSSEGGVLTHCHQKIPEESFRRAKNFISFKTQKMPFGQVKFERIPGLWWCCVVDRSTGHNISRAPARFEHKYFMSNSWVSPGLEWPPDYWSLNFSISPSNEYSGLISFRMDWFHLLVVQGTLRSLLQHHSSKASVIYSQLSLWSNSHIHTWLLEKP